MEVKIFFGVLPFYEKLYLYTSTYPRIFGKTYVRTVINDEYSRRYGLFLFVSCIFLCEYAIRRVFNTKWRMQHYTPLKKNLSMQKVSWKNYLKESDSLQDRTRRCPVSSWNIFRSNTPLSGSRRTPLHASRTRSNQGNTPLSRYNQFHNSLPFGSLHYRHISSLELVCPLTYVKRYLLGKNIYLKMLLFVHRKTLIIYRYILNFFSYSNYIPTYL